MIRLHIGSLRHYPGRSVFHAVLIISSEITGGVPVYKHPGTVRECPALSVRYETKKADRK